MFNEQCGLCAICGKDLIENRCCIDHDHKTGEVRGLLCNNCNALLGFSTEDKIILQGAICYLDMWRK